MINPFKTKNAIIARNDCLYKIKAPFFGDIEVTRIDFPHIKGQKVVVKVADESNSPKLFNDRKKRKNGISK
jgi:hypothetical protein